MLHTQHIHTRARARAHTEIPLFPPSLPSHHALYPADLCVSPSVSLFPLLAFLSLHFLQHLPTTTRRRDVVTFFPPCPPSLFPVLPKTPSPFPLVRPRPPSLPIMLPYCLGLLSLTPKPVQIASSPRARVRASSPSRFFYLRFFSPSLDVSCCLFLSLSLDTRKRIRNATEKDAEILIAEERLRFDPKLGDASFERRVKTQSLSSQART